MIYDTRIVKKKLLLHNIDGNNIKNIEFYIKGYCFGKYEEERFVCGYELGTNF